jgi:hypothetical protein
LLLAAALSLQLGCPRPSPSSSGVGPSDPEGEIVKRRELFSQAIRSILEYQQYDDAEMFQQAVARLDQWVQRQKPLDDWRVDPLLSTLPEPFSPFIDSLELEGLDFAKADPYLFLEAAWLRDVSIWARGDAVDELDQACRLFDWTVRNVQLEWERPAGGTGSTVRLLQKPWETLLFGRGTATDRAWVFILLARQQGIDAALLAVPDPNDASGQRLQQWAVAVLSQGQLYLFEPALGVPIPAPNGLHRRPSEPLEVRPATLAQVAEDDALLRQLDVGDVRYPIDSSQVQGVIALLEASPNYISQRSKLVENRLTGDERFVLTTDPSAQAERFKACPHVVEARLWELPYQTLAQEIQLGAARTRWLVDRMTPFMAPTGPHPGLWRGRQHHFKGIFTGEQSATAYYQDARPPDRLIRETEGLDPSMRVALARAKMDASYWLGLIAAEQGNHEAAIDWLATRTLKADPNGPWTGGAIYSLGRVYEANGQIAEAAQTYRSDRRSPALRGNLVRANWLQPQPTAKRPAQPPPGEAKPEAAPAAKQPAPEKDESPKKAEPPPQEEKQAPPKASSDPVTETPPEPSAGDAEEPASKKAEQPPNEPDQQPKAETPESGQSSPGQA